MSALFLWNTRPYGASDGEYVDIAPRLSTIEQQIAALQHRLTNVEATAPIGVCLDDNERDRARRLSARRIDQLTRERDEMRAQRDEALAMRDAANERAASYDQLVQQRYTQLLDTLDERDRLQRERDALAAQHATATEALRQMIAERDKLTEEWRVAHARSTSYAVALQKIQALTEDA